MSPIYDADAHINEYLLTPNNTYTAERYYYNRDVNDGLVLAKSNSGNKEPKIDNIKLIEVDRMPFFNYFENGTSSTIFIDNSVSSPQLALAPFIDYTNQNFSFIGNVTFIDADTIGSVLVAPIGSGTDNDSKF